jgi:sulfofructose kinase
VIVAGREMRHLEVIGIGLCTVDLLFVVPRSPTFGGLMRASAYLRQGGGPVATALVALARLGIATRFVGRVGDDDDGDFIRADFDQERVDCSRIEVETGALSRVALVLVDEATGERGFAGRPESCRPLTVDDLDRGEIAAAQVLHLDDADEPSLQAARWAREDGTCVVFDGTWNHEDLDAFLPLVDVPIVSEPFVEAWMPGASPREVVDRLWGYGPRIAVYTLGEKGCVVRWEEGVFSFPCFPIDVIDTTGAGDAFHGGFIYGLLQEWEVERTVRFASVVAALNCRQLGGRTGLPDRDEVDGFLRDTPKFEK